MSPPKVLAALERRRPSGEADGRGVAPARVVFTSGFSARYTGGVREFEIEAKNLRGVIKAMDSMFPGLGRDLEDETTVAIDGELFEVDISRAGEAGGGGVLYSEDRGRIVGP